MQTPSKILDRLYLGSYESAKNRQALDERKISHILTVGSSLSPAFENAFVYKIVKIADIESENLGEHFLDMMNFIEEGMKSGGVLVHCAAGVSRSGATVVGFIMKTKKITYQEALEFVRKRRPVVCPNDGFVVQLQEFEKQVLK